MQKTLNNPDVKKFLKHLLLFMSFASLALIVAQFFQSFVHAQDLQSTLGEVNKGVNLPGFGSGTDQSPAHSQASYQPGASGITSAIYFVVDLFKYGMGTIAVMVIIASGVRLITAGNQVEEIAGQQKENIKYAVIGLIVIMLADVMVKQVFFGEQGEVLRSQADVQQAAERGTEQIRGLYNFMEYFIGAVAVLMIIVAGIRMVVSGGNEDVLGKQKKVIMWAILGIVLIGISELVVKDIVFPQQGSELSDVNRARELIVNITNFVSAFVATVAIAMGMYGGFLYVTAVGKEEQTGKAKKVLMGAAIGIIIALGAFALVNTFIKFDAPAQTTGNLSGDVVGNPVTEP